MSQYVRRVMCVMMCGNVCVCDICMSIWWWASIRAARLLSLQRLTVNKSNQQSSINRLGMATTTTRLRSVRTPLLSFQNNLTSHDIENAGKTKRNYTMTNNEHVHVSNGVVVALLISLWFIRLARRKIHTMPFSHVKHYSSHISDTYIWQYRLLLYLYM